MLRERNGPHRPSFNFVRTSHSSASYRAYRPGIGRARNYRARNLARLSHAQNEIAPSANRGRALFRSDGRVAVKHRGRSLSKSDRCCQRQRLSFIRRGVVPVVPWENATLSMGWPDGRSEQAKLTACRKVWRMYRRDPGKSSRNGWKRGRSGPSATEYL